LIGKVDLSHAGSAPDRHDLEAVQSEQPPPRFPHSPPIPLIMNAGFRTSVETAKGEDHGPLRLATSLRCQRTAQSGSQALEAARLRLPHLIFLDIGLPGMTGYEVGRQLREEEWGKDALIVGVSGYGQEADRQRPKAAGFDYHLSKPGSYDELHTLLRPKSKTFT
jgi:CheY-like chemotaxis protein